MKKWLQLTSVALLTLLSTEGFAQQQEPYPLEYWALRSVNSNVTLSPDGERVAMRTIASKNARPIIEVYDTNDLSKDPYRISADPMEIQGFYWVSDRKMVMSLRQKVRDRIDGFNQGVYEGKIALVDVEKRKIKSFKEQNPSIENLLVNEPNKVILSFSEGGDAGAGLSSAFRPRAYWEFNLDNGTKKLLIRGKISLGNIDFDGEGNPLGARGFDVANGEFITYYRPKGTKKWVEVLRQSEDSFESLNFVGMDEYKPNHALVLANNGHDKVGLWSFDIENKKFDELVYRRNDVDVAGVRYHSNTWTNPDSIVGVSYFTDNYYFNYFDEIEGAIYQQLNEVIPNAHYTRITSRSRDGNTMVINNIGPRDPGTFYLLKNGQLQVVGSRQPLLSSENLADVKYVTWKARDGATVPGYVTVPNGKPPYPLVVMPHGGPFVDEFVLYDEWSQMLANNGYMVLQPQYRGSLNYGQEFYKSAFVNGGQGGGIMQDDKDDGAMYLVEQGLADPDRMAMFGWSYGGYAALVAAARTPQIYQCVIAGAAVTDNNMQVNYYRYRLRGAQKTEQLRFWDDSVSPIEEVEKVNVPLLMIHGDVDQRVPPEHAERYVKELEKHNKNFQFKWLEGADHFSNTLFYHHKIDLYESMIDFLANDCGDGGLTAAK